MSRISWATGLLLGLLLVRSAPLDAQDQVTGKGAAFYRLAAPRR
jgi:hypothetical protein